MSPSVVVLSSLGDIFVSVGDRDELFAIRGTADDFEFEEFKVGSSIPGAGPDEIGGVLFDAWFGFTMEGVDG